MTDPTYVKTEIAANPEWDLAFVLSEILNDRAPVGWSTYRGTAQCLLAEFEIHRKGESSAPETIDLMVELRKSLALTEAFEAWYNKTHRLRVVDTTHINDAEEAFRAGAAHARNGSARPSEIELTPKKGTHRQRVMQAEADLRDWCDRSRDVPPGDLEEFATDLRLVLDANVSLRRNLDDAMALLVPADTRIIRAEAGGHTAAELDRAVDVCLRAGDASRIPELPPLPPPTEDRGAIAAEEARKASPHRFGSPQ